MISWCLVIWLATSSAALAFSPTIDIKPGSYPNAINLGREGVIAVAIFSSGTFDATTIDPETVRMAGAGVAIRGKGDKTMAHKEDVDGDGFVDLVVHIEVVNLDPGLQSGYVSVVGYTYDGQPFWAHDEIIIVPAGD
jgi:hypothetical protein